MWLDFKLWIAWQSTVNTAYCIRIWWARSFPSFLVAKDCFYYSLLLCYEYSYIWEMPTCQHTNTASSTLIRLDTVTTNSMWVQEVNLYITLCYTCTFPNGFSWNKSHSSTWQKNCMCIYQHVWPAFPRSTIQAIFKVN